MTSQVIKVGQVWKEINGHQLFVILATSWDKVFVCGVADMVNPLIDKANLVNNYELSTEFYEI